jgi:cell division protease FtsH
MKRIIKKLGWAFLALIALSAIFSLFSPTPVESPKEVSLSKLAQSIKAGEVKEIAVSGETLLITNQNEETYQVYKEEGSLTDSLSRLGLTAEELQAVNIKVEPETTSFWSSIFPLLLSFVIPVFFFLFFFWFLFHRAKGGLNQTLNILQSPDQQFNPQASKEKVGFDDIGNLVEAKEELMEIADFLKSPQKFLKMGAKIPRGVLLAGPPGCGKTLLARAIASSTNVPFYYISGSEFIELFVGVGSKRVKSLFAKAKQSQPSIIFIDELDAIGRRRGVGLIEGHNEREQTLNQILTEMDGFQRESRCIVLAATNRPDILDPALLRPGRFDRRIVIDLPDITSREKILKIHCRNKPLDSQVNLTEIAEQTPGFSGADLEDLANEAAVLATRREKTKIEQTDFLESIEKVLLGPERKSHLLSPKEKEVAAYHEAGHALISALTPKADQVRKISIIARGFSAGHTLTTPATERGMQAKSQLIAQLATLLGGYAAEKIFFKEVTTGAANDLQRATDLAKKMVTEYGMSKLGPVNFSSSDLLVWQQENPFNRQNYSEEIARVIDNQIKEFLNQALKYDLKLLQKKKKLMKQLAEELIKKETLNQKEFEKILKKEENKKKGKA